MINRLLPRGIQLIKSPFVLMQSDESNPLLQQHVAAPYPEPLNAFQDVSLLQPSTHSQISQQIYHSKTLQLLLFLNTFVPPPSSPLSDSLSSSLFIDSRQLNVKGLNMSAGNRTCACRLLLETDS